MKNVILAAALTLAGLSANAANVNVTCTANQNGQGVLITQGALSVEGTQGLSADKGPYTYEMKVYNGKLLYVSATDKATGTKYQSTSISEKSYYLDLEVYEKSGKVLVFQCSLN